VQGQGAMTGLFLNLRDDDWCRPRRWDCSRPNRLSKRFRNDMAEVRSRLHRQPRDHSPDSEGMSREGTHSAGVRAAAPGSAIAWEIASLDRPEQVTLVGLAVMRDFVFGIGPVLDALHCLEVEFYPAPLVLVVDGIGVRTETVDIAIALRQAAGRH